MLCGDKKRCISVKKTREIMVDFKREKDPPLLYLRRVDVDMASSNKYPDVHFFNDLTWSANTSCLVRKSLSASQHSQLAVKS